MSIDISSVIPGKDILARDLHSKTGILLLPSGSIITRSFKERLRKFGITKIVVL